MMSFYLDGRKCCVSSPTPARTRWTLTSWTTRSRWLGEMQRGVRQEFSGTSWSVKIHFFSYISFFFFSFMRSFTLSIGTNSSSFFLHLSLSLSLSFMSLTQSCSSSFTHNCVINLNLSKKISFHFPHISDLTGPSERCPRHRRHVRRHLRSHQVHDERRKPSARHHPLQTTPLRRGGSSSLELDDGNP